MSSLYLSGGQSHFRPNYTNSISERWSNSDRRCSYLFQKSGVSSIESLTLFIPNHWKGHLDFAHWLQFDNPSSGAHCQVDSATPFLKTSMGYSDLSITTGQAGLQQAQISTGLPCIPQYSAVTRVGMRRLEAMLPGIHARTPASYLCQ